jgi:hypothetical protein
VAASAVAASVEGEGEGEEGEVEVEGGGGGGAVACQQYSTGMSCSSRLRRWMPAACTAACMHAEPAGGDKLPGVSGVCTPQPTIALKRTVRYGIHNWYDTTLVALHWGGLKAGAFHATVEKARRGKVGRTWRVDATASPCTANAKRRRGGGGGGRQWYTRASSSAAVAPTGTVCLAAVTTQRPVRRLHRCT